MNGFSERRPRQGTGHQYVATPNTKYRQADACRSPVRSVQNGVARRLDIAIDQVFEHLLTTAGVRCGFAFFDDVGFQFPHVRRSVFNFATDTAVVAAVAFLDKARQNSVRSDRRCDFQTSGKGIHAADVSVEKVDRVDTFTADFGVKVCTTGAQATSRGLERDIETFERYGFRHLPSGFWLIVSEQPNAAERRCGCQDRGCQRRLEQKPTAADGPQKS